MIDYFSYKLALWLLLIPISFGMTYFAKRIFKKENAIRLLIERHGTYKAAQYLSLIFYIVVGITLTIFLS